jgi:hypothetical protein
VVSGLDMFDDFDLVLGHVGDALAENTSDHRDNCKFVAIG